MFLLLRICCIFEVNFIVKKHVKKVNNNDFITKCMESIRCGNYIIIKRAMN